MRVFNQHVSTVSARSPSSCADPRSHVFSISPLLLSTVSTNMKKERVRAATLRPVSPPGLSLLKSALTMLIVLT